MPGGIIPDYGVAQGVPLAPRYAVAPVDNTIPAIMGEVTKLGLATAGVASTLAAHKSRVSNTTEIAKRKMMIETDLDTLQSDIRGDRDLHKEAVSQYNEAIKPLSEKWVKGLSPDLTAVVQEYAVRKAITGRHTMQGVQDKYLVDDAANTTDNFERTRIDRAGRLDLTDADVFDGVAPGRAQLYVTEQPSSVVVKSDYRQGLDAFVASGAMTADRAGDRERNLLDAMAYRRIQRMAISDNPGVVQGALDVLDKDESEPGSTVARYLKTEHKNALRQAAQGQRDKIQRDAISLANQSYIVAEREKKDIETAQKKTDNVEITDLALGVLRGEKGLKDLNQALIVNPTLQENRETVEHIQGLIDKRDRQGGVTNWALYNQFREEIVRTRGAANITQRLLAKTAVPGGIAWDDADKLMAMSSALGERSVYKDDYFQRGQADINRVLQPEIGLADIGNAKARRLAEASREFEDRAGLLIERGEREKIPTVAREITDRYVKQAPKVSVDVRFTPRHQDAQTLTEAFIRDYGPDRLNWPPHAKDEYDRQARILKGIATDRAKASDNKPGPPAGKPKPYQPDVISR